MVTQRRALLVLGMHRSGTSALTRILNIYGAALPANLLPANSGNETGYWESPELNRLHNSVLERAGSSWDSPEWFSLKSLPPPIMREYASELAAVIDAEFGDAPLVVVKDPRLCRLVPLWLQALALLKIQPYAVLAVRHPAESAASLLHRDGMPEGAALLLWLQYVLSAEEGSRQIPRALIFYDDLLADCAGAVLEIEAALGLTLPGRSAAADAEAAAFLTPSLRHERVPDGDLESSSALHGWVRTVYESFNRARHIGLPADVAALDAIRAELAEAETLFGPSLRWLQQREQQRTAHFVAESAHFVAESKYWREFSEASAAASRAQAEQLQLQAEQLASRVETLVALDTTQREQLEQLESQLAARLAREAALCESLGQLQADLAAAAASEQILWARLARIEGTLVWRTAEMGTQLRPQTGGMAVTLMGRLERTLRYQRIHGTRKLIDESLAMLKRMRPGSSSGKSAPARTESGWINARELVNFNHSATMPLRLFTAPGAAAPRVSLVTDSINRGSFDGGAGTAAILAALIADAKGARLRIITRREPAHPAGLEGVLDACGIALSSEIEFAHAPCHESGYDLDVFAGELFVTTSWWTTASAMASVPAETIVYLLQEDERLLYPSGDEYLRCSRVLMDVRIQCVVNTELLFDHLVESGLTHLTSTGTWFEPAFPPGLFHPGPRSDGGKRTLMLYARPNDSRNLFLFGLELLETAITRGVLDLDVWDIVLFGKDIPKVRFNDGRCTPKRLEHLTWPEYADVVGQADLGLCLMHSPEPGRQVLDLAASGAVVVTNRFGLKQSLERYSKNIVCADLEIPSMLGALAEGLRLAGAMEEREANRRDNGLGTDWHAAFAGVVRRFGCLG